VLPTIRRAHDSAYDLQVPQLGIHRNRDEGTVQSQRWQAIAMPTTCMQHRRCCQTRSSGSDLALRRSEFVYGTRRARRKQIARLEVDGVSKQTLAVSFPGHYWRDGVEITLGLPSRFTLRCPALVARCRPQCKDRLQRCIASNVPPVSASADVE
jgi:hypothetical protein